MFTGIIQQLGVIQSCQKSGGQLHLAICFGGSLTRPLAIGESIAVNGVCLTAAKINGKVFEADLVRETLEATTLGGLRKNEKVNLERSLCYGDSMGGHFVTGHVDGRGKILAIERQGKNILLRISAPAAVKPFLAVKGSVALDGISLTVQKISGSDFFVAIVPHTLQATNLFQKKAGAEVNLEIDLITRYMKEVFDRRTKAKLVPSRRKNKGKIRELQKQGF